jgi:hypothetical protein
MLLKLKKCSIGCFWRLWRGEMDWHVDKNFLEVEGQGIGD